MLFIKYISALFYRIKPNQYNHDGHNCNCDIIRKCLCLMQNQSQNYVKTKNSSDNTTVFDKIPSKLKPKPSTSYSVRRPSAGDNVPIVGR